MGIGQRESAYTLSKAESPIKFSGAVKVSGMNGEMKSRPQTDIGFGLKGDVRRLYRGLQLVVICPRQVAYQRPQQYP